MAIDFRASQVQTNKIIASGSTGTGAQLLIYGIAGQDSVSPNQGIINPAAFGTGSIGTDIFLFISGTISASSAPAVSTFGGDLIVSGVLMSRMTKTFLFIGSYAATSATASNAQVTGQALLSPHEVPMRSVVLRTILSTTDPAVTSSVQLWNITSGSFVHIGGAGITTLNTVSSTPVTLTSVDLNSATNFSSTSAAIYEVRVYIATGSAQTIHGSSMFVCGA